MSDDREYAEFRRRYEARNPASIPVKRYELPPYPPWVQWATFLMFAASAVLSGVHTVPVVRAGIPATVGVQLAEVVSYAGFLCVELPILLATYALAGGGGLTVRLTLTLATLTALTCNIYSVVNAYAAASLSGDVWTLIVAVVVGIVAPGIAFLSGKMFVQMHRADRSVKQHAADAYRAEGQAWDARILRAWDAYQERVQAAVREADTLRTREEELSRMADALRAREEESSRVASNPASIVREHLSEHPEHRTLSARELAALLNVGKSTAAVVKAEFPSNDGQSDNHNGTH